MTATLASMPILSTLPILPALRFDQAGAIRLHSRQEHGDAR